MARVTTRRERASQSTSGWIGSGRRSARSRGPSDSSARGSWRARGSSRPEADQRVSAITDEGSKTYLVDKDSFFATLGQGSLGGVGVPENSTWQ